MLVYPRRTVCIRVVRFTLQHDGRLVPATARHIACFTSANHLCKVFLSAEQYFYIFVQTTTSVETGIDDDTFAVIVFTQDIGIDGTETFVVHRFDVYISQTAVRPFRYIGSTLFYPALVQQITKRSSADRTYHFVPVFLGLRIVQRYQYFLASLAVQQRSIVFISLDRFTVDLFNNSSDFDTGSLTVERTFLYHLGNTQAVARIIPVVQHAQLGCRLCFQIRIETSAGMRNIQFTQQFT